MKYQDGTIFMTEDEVSEAVEMYIQHKQGGEAYGVTSGDKLKILPAPVVFDQRYDFMVCSR